MEQKKINELKKLMAFGYSLHRRMIENPDFNMIFCMMHDDAVIELLAAAACAFEYDYKKHNLINMFKEPHTTQLLENTLKDVIKFAKKERE